MAARLDLVAARNVAWALTINIYYRGAALPLTGAAIKMQVRLYAGQPGDPKAEHAAIPFTDIAAPIDQIPDQRLLQLAPLLSEAVLKAMPTGLNQPEPGEADQFFYDIVVIYGDAMRDTLAEGSFFLKPGVTV